ncbi:MAG TPA: hypothetical protein VGT41_05895 [Candidatus Babeliales bacterium]|nr:hypothetical protein [Candidatus Babeliales bacterium]
MKNVQLLFTLAAFVIIHHGADAAILPTTASSADTELTKSTHLSSKPEQKQVSKATEILHARLAEDVSTQESHPDMRKRNSFLGGSTVEAVGRIIGAVLFTEYVVSPMTDLFFR